MNKLPLPVLFALMCGLMFGLLQIVLFKPWAVAFASAVVGLLVGYWVGRMGTRKFGLPSSATLADLTATYEKGARPKP